MCVRVCVSVCVSVYVCLYLSVCVCVCRVFAVAWERETRENWGPKEGVAVDFAEKSEGDLCTCLPACLFLYPAEKRLGKHHEGRLDEWMVF